MEGVVSATVEEEQEESTAVSDSSGSGGVVELERSMDTQQKQCDDERDSERMASRRDRRMKVGRH